MLLLRDLAANPDPQGSQLQSVSRLPCMWVLQWIQDVERFHGPVRRIFDTK